MDTAASTKSTPTSRKNSKSITRRRTLTIDDQKNESKQLYGKPITQKGNSFEIAQFIIKKKNYLKYEFYKNFYEFEFFY